MVHWHLAAHCTNINLVPGRQDVCVRAWWWVVEWCLPCVLLQMAAMVVTANKHKHSDLPARGDPDAIAKQFVLQLGDRKTMPVQELRAFIDKHFEAPGRYAIVERQSDQRL